MNLDVRDLRVAFGDREVLGGLSFGVAAGEIVALVGESGAGKSVTALALLGLLPRHARVSGEIRLLGRLMTGQPEREWTRVRGRGIAMVFQDPLAALTPVRTVGAQMTEAVRIHAGGERARQQAAELLELVGIPRERHRAYPHELSGGMRQRVLIAMAVAHRPAVLVADEPTASLDPMVREQILDLLCGLCVTSGTGLLLISHDLELVHRRAHRVLALRDGRPADRPPAATTGTPSMRRRVDGPPVLAVRGLVCTRGTTRVLDGVDLEVGEGEIVGLAGVSGAGKTTLLREVLRLERPREGRIEVCGQDTAGLGASARRELRARVQPVFQDPWSSLDPRMTVGQLVAEPLRIHRRPVDGQVERLLELVELPAQLAGRRPRALSGGQRQRVAIARALALAPRLLLADEPVSALDTRAKAGIVALLRRLRDRLGLACLLVSHDESMLGGLADRIVVLRDGRTGT